MVPRQSLSVADLEPYLLRVISTGLARFHLSNREVFGRCLSCLVRFFAPNYFTSSFSLTCSWTSEFAVTYTIS